MRASRRDVLIGLASGLAAPAIAAPVIAAEKYPARPVRFVAGFAAGGPVDIVARVMAEWLSNDLGQQFVVDNRAGSGGNIGAAAVINSPPDGYTILFAASSNAISASLYKKLPFDFIRDTVPVAGIMRLTNVMVVPPSLPAKTVAEFIALAKARPGELSFASSGNGTSVHLSGELFKMLAQIDIIHVPYRGSAPAYPDLMTNKVQVCSTICRARSSSCAAGSCARSAVTVRSGGRRCLMCRRSPRRFRATRRARGTASRRPRARRPTLSRR